MGKKNRHEKKRLADKLAQATPLREPAGPGPLPTDVTHLDLVVDIRSAWHAGSGRGGGYRADALVRRDREGFPVLPGKHIAGLLRNAMECLEAWGHATTGTTVRLFGPEPGKPAESGSPEPSLGIGSAVMPQSDRQALSKIEGAVAALFRVSQHTAIDAKTGSAKPRHLRSIEAAVPMCLVAPLTMECAEPGSGFNDRDRKALERAVALVHAVGGWRTRGFGRATLNLEQES